MNKLLVLILITLTTLADAQNASAIGDSLYALGDYSKAITYYEEASETEKIAISYDALGNGAKALQFYKKALSVKEASLLTQYNYGKLLLKAAQYEKADSLFQILTKASPKNSEFVYQLGLIKEKRNDSTAYPTFFYAHVLDKNHQNALYKIAKYAAEERDFDTAKKHIKSGLEVDANSTRFLQLKAIVAFVEKEYHTAAQTYEALLKLSQSNIPQHENLAVSYTKTNRFEEAIEQYTLLINEYDDKNPSWHFSIAKNFEALRYLDKAQHHFEIAILLQDIPLDNSYVALASVFKKQKDYKNQLEALQKAVEENPENGTALYLLATAADNYFEDEASVIPYYEAYLKKFGENVQFSEYAKQRIKDIKTDLHFNKN
ncbi:tetratricopeptide repeat protein [Rasiella sp. SM2506]|uniref:tetratricopeptide repeat protein n=1 Tax=Rasiella sp. SM2506 TaxID=3423914 RepID=UPI003D78D27B